MDFVRKTILIVDDDADDRELFAEAVKAADVSAQCIYAINGFNALELLSLTGMTTPDFIFLDLNMPLMDGKECLIHLRRLSGLKDIPVIILSTSFLAEDKTETLKLGASLYFTKPSTFDKLVNTVQFVLAEEWKNIEEFRY